MLLVQVPKVAAQSFNNSNQAFIVRPKSAKEACFKGRGKSCYQKLEHPEEPNSDSSLLLQDYFESLLAEPDVRSH